MEQFFDIITITSTGALLLIALIAPLCSGFYRCGRLIRNKVDTSEGIENTNEDTEDVTENIKESTTLPTISIILNIEGESEALRHNLPIYLQQDYAGEYDVIIIIRKGDHEVEDVLSRYEDNVKTGYDFRLDKFVNKKMISSLQAAMIQYDTLSEEPNHWIIKNYTERDLKGMREVITSGGRIDSIINMQPQDLLIQKGQQQTLTNPQLAQYIERQKQRGFANIQAFEVEYYQRGASSFAAFILTAIGLSLSAKKRKNGMGISLGIGLLLSFAYIMFQTISATFAIQANFPPMLAVWIPNIVFMFIAVYCYKFAPK